MSKAHGLASSRKVASQTAGETRAALIQAALRLFGQKGFDGTSTREIATAAGANIGSIAYHFGGKEGLHTATADHIVETAQDSVVAIIGVSRLKSRDESTYLHSLAVSALMVSFGRALGLSEASVRTLAVGGLLHDIGKMAVPVEILSSRKKLSGEELAIVRSHPARGHEMLREFDDVPPLVLEICLHHHERHDGRGYPFGLKGNGIPFAARLAAICDVYEAMTTIRPYKPAWSSTEAIGVMLQSHGQFDPSLLRRFLSMILSGETV